VNQIGSGHNVPAPEPFSGDLEDWREVEVYDQYDRLSRNESFGKGRIVLQIHDEKLFGRWGTFGNCVKGRLKLKDPRYAYFLMDGVKNFDLLEEAANFRIASTRSAL
jgi:hypothetical protein